ncbi:MAG: Hsp70 family protein, partial [Pseudomonadota bacterium]|nr:Hsp70 family protein [Pseudomonadota bacterium]
IQNMVQDAEEHAEEDRKARELVDARNQGEAMIHSVRKSMTDLGDKVESADKDNIDSAIKELEEVLQGEDKEAVVSKTEALAQASHKLAEQVYHDAEAQQGAGEAADAQQSAPETDDVVDAEFEEVKDDDKKS